MRSSLKMFFVSLVTVTVLLCSTSILGQQLKNTRVDINGTETGSGFGWDFKATLDLTCGSDTVISDVNVTTCQQGLVNCGQLTVICPLLNKEDIQTMCENKQNCSYNRVWRCGVSSYRQVTLEVWYTCSEVFPVESTEPSGNSGGTTVPHTKTTLREVQAAVTTVATVTIADSPEQLNSSTTSTPNVLDPSIPLNTGFINNGNLIVVIGTLSAVIVILVCTLAATLFFFLYLKPRHHMKTEGKRNQVTCQNNGTDVTTNDVDTGYYNVPETNDVSSELALETNGDEDYERVNTYANDPTNNLYSSLS